MNLIYVLMVLTATQTGGYYGSGIMSFQEFTTKQRCEYAKSLFIADKSVKLATCVEK